MTELIAKIIIGVGLAFDAFGIIGLIRLPDVYNRVQASTKCVTLGTCMILFGVFLLALGMPAPDMGIKAIVCLVFVLLTSPVAAHAIARGAHISGIRLWQGSVVDKYLADREGDEPEGVMRS